MNDYTSLGKFQRNSLSTLHIQSMICHSGTWKKLLKTRSTFSPLTPHIFHDGNGSEQVDLLPILYKRIKSHSPKVSSTIHSFPSLCSRERTDLTIGGSLAGLHLSPLTFFFLGLTAITIAWTISAYWFSCIIKNNKSKRGMEMCKK